MNMKSTRRMALAGLLAPVAIGLLAACSSGVAGRAGIAEGSSAGVTGAVAGSASSSLSASASAPPSTAVAVSSVPASSDPVSSVPASSDPASVPDSAAHGPAAAVKQSKAGGSGGAINQGANGAAAGAAGIGAQTAPSKPPHPRFTSFSLTEPSTCPSGGAVTPQLSWKTADATAVGVSVDHPGAVSDYGAFDKAGTLSLPAVVCAGSPGTKITHRYDVWALGPSASSHRVVMLRTTVKIEVKVSAGSPMPTYTAVPPIVKPGPMPTYTVAPPSKLKDPLFPPIPIPGAPVPTT